MVLTCPRNSDKLILERNIMKRITLIIFLIFLSCFACLAQSDTISRKSIYDEPDYSKPLIPLKELVRKKAKSQTNTFYVSKVQIFNNGGRHAWVYWKEQNALILWEAGGMGSENLKNELVWSRRFLRFGKEIVPPSRFYQGSNFLTLMKDGLALKRECLDGYKFVISKPNRRRKS
jgi:hypothetical protein